MLWFLTLGKFHQFTMLIKNLTVNRSAKTILFSVCLQSALLISEFMHWVRKFP